MILGMNQLRMSASSLTYIGQMNGASQELKESITKSFLSGLIARHLAQQSGLPDAEEAFICGLFQNIGENLVIYYFEEEYEEIRKLCDSTSADQRSASEAILGIGFDDLGAAVARSWKLPESIVQCILGSAGDDGGETAAETAKLGHVAVFANELCGIANLPEQEDREAELRRLIGRFAECLPIRECIARSWKLPESIVQCILGSAGDDGGETAAETAKLGHVAVFANELCGIANLPEQEDREAELRRLIGRFAECLPVSEEYALKLLAAGMNKLRENARIFEIDVKNSGFCDAVTAWVTAAGDN